jgi:branched-chain amino acid transport system ATP-binding protein
VAEPELLVDDVHTFYGDSYVLQGVSLSMGKGSVVAVLGRNGVGKTTLVRTVIAFTPARRGRVLFAGQDVTRLPAYRIAQAGMALVPQGRRVFASLTVRENLEIANGRSAPGRASLEWTLDAVLHLFPRLRERLSNRGGTLSGGEQQMLAIGRALIAQSTPSLTQQNCTALRARARGRPAVSTGDHRFLPTLRSSIGG